MKRTDYISWDEYFFGIAKLSSFRSKDPSTQVGACIVNSDKKIVGIGYNGFPVGISDDELSWEKESENSLDTKYPYVCHAELNAILNSTLNIKGATIYVTLFPCHECCKAIIQSGIKCVKYLDDKGFVSESEKASQSMFEKANILFEKCTIDKEVTIKNA